MPPGSGKTLLLLRICSMPFDLLKTFRASRAVRVLDEARTLDEALQSSARTICDELHAAAGPKIEGDPEQARRRLAVVAIGRAVHNARPVDDKLLARAGDRLSGDLRERILVHRARDRDRSAVRERYEEAFRADLFEARSALTEIAKRPLFEEGLRLSSRTLLESSRRACAAAPSGWGHDERHVAAKAVSYLSRFITKTSPNGVFCTTALAEAGGGEANASGENALVRRDIIFNVAEARKITACLAVDPAARPAVTPRPNPTLRRDEEGWIFWRPATARNAEDDEVLTRVKENPVAKALVEEAGGETMRMPELLDAIAERFNLDREEIESFAGKLARSGLLVAEVEIPYSERRPLAYLAAACRASGCEARWLSRIETVEAAVSELPAAVETARIEAMDGLEERIRLLPHARQMKWDELFRLDAASGMRVTLTGDILAELRPAVRWYARLFASIYPERMRRNSYARTFLRHHPADTDVALLDLYHGLFEPARSSRPSDFPDPAAMAGKGEGLAEARAALDRARAGLARRAREANAVRSEEVELDDAAWREFLGEWSEPRWSAGALFQVAAGSAHDVEAGRYRLALNALFSGTGLALTRFAHLHGGDGPPDRSPIARAVRDSWTCVEKDGAVMAEITYMHTGRTANAGLRPVLFRHEIELPGEKASPGATAIPLRDLVVRYESAGGRFVLRWPSRDVEIIPVISSGISPEGFVAFLASIGLQGLQPLSYFPGFDVEGIDRWPRITSGRVVLFRRRWIFATGGAATEIPAPAGPGVTNAGFFAETARWRERAEIPRHVYVHTSADPKPFYLDLESPLFVDLFRRALGGMEGSGSGKVTITEMLPGPDELWVRDRQGRYATEFLVHLHSPGDSAVRGERKTPS